MSGWSRKSHLSVNPSQEVVGAFPDDPNPGVSTEELRRRAIEEEAIAAAKLSLYGRNETLRKFLAETPAYVNNERNAGLIESRLRSILSARGEVWPEWTVQDLHRAADTLHAEGALQVSGEYTPKGPTETEMYEMPLHELRQKLHGERLGPLDV